MPDPRSPIRYQGSILPVRDWGAQLREPPNQPAEISHEILQAIALMVGMEYPAASGGLFVPHPLATDSSGHVLISSNTPPGTVQVADGTTPAQLLAIDASGRLTLTPTTSIIAYPFATLPTAQNQLVTHGANTITLAAAGVGKRNVLLQAVAGIYGSGTAPTNAAPLLFTIADGPTTITQLAATAFNAAFGLLGGGGQPFGVAGTANTAMTISCPDPGANVTVNLNVISTVI